MLSTQFGATAARTVTGTAAALLAALFVAGCSTPMDQRRDASYQSYASVADRPMVRPTRSISSFSPSLACMDQMLRAAELPTTLITSKQIPDYSGKISVSTKDMIVTALSQMSRQSNAFRFVDYEVDIVHQDTVQNLTMLMLNSNQVQLQRPALYFSGSIAFVDQNVLNNRLDAGISGSRVDAAYSQNRNASVIGLEMHLGDFRTRTLIPGMDSANEVIVGTGGQGVDLAGRIGTYGVQFNVGRDYTQGSGSAVRTLVELATVELVGKWARVPYWQCLTLEQTHPDFQRQMRDWYDQGQPIDHAQLLKNALVSRGYLTGATQTVDVTAPPVREAISRFQADAGLVVSGLVDFPTYERAMRNFVGLGANGELVRIGWPATATAVPVAVAAPGASSSGLQSATATISPDLDLPPGRPGSLDMQIENLKMGRALYEVGDQVFLSVVPTRASYLSCYQQNARGIVLRLLPNNANRTMWVPANYAVRIPDWMSPNPGFIMDAEAPGTETVACYATDDDQNAKLPEALRGAGLRPIPEYASLVEVNKAFELAWGPAGYSTNALSWQVEPRRSGGAK
jgi:hypothetical protein